MSNKQTARAAGLAVVLMGAISSFALMLYAAQRQQSLFLKLLFTAWTMAPFLALVSGYLLSVRWPSIAMTALHIVATLTTITSLATDCAVSFHVLNVKVGTVFLIIPGASLVVIAIGFAAMRPMIVGDLDV